MRPYMWSCGVRVEKTVKIVRGPRGSVLFRQRELSGKVRELDGEG
jgi:hypothetical protein